MDTYLYYVRDNDGTTALKEHTMQLTSGMLISSLRVAIETLTAFCTWYKLTTSNAIWYKAHFSRSRSCCNCSTRVPLDAFQLALSKTRDTCDVLERINGSHSTNPAFKTLSATRADTCPAEREGEGTTTVQRTGSSYKPESREPVNPCNVSCAGALRGTFRANLTEIVLMLHLHSLLSPGTHTEGWCRG